MFVMGEEISSIRFNKTDFAQFHKQLETETALLQTWFERGYFEPAPQTIGFELEAWLVDERGHPATAIESVLAELNDPAAVHELAQFNIELNGDPVRLGGNALSAFHSALEKLWIPCEAEVEKQGMQLLMAGILPTLRADELTLANMSSLLRYRALNEQVLRMRAGKPLELDIQGREHLKMLHQDVMLEAAATSFQLHLRVDAGNAVRFYNASKVLSGPIVAICANSPYLFGRDLWDESRIPLFEQAVAVGATADTRRVTFGIRYAKDSIFECFADNLSRYPVLLPRVTDSIVDELAHLRLHNGTIWRWTRPLIGIDEAGAHIRLEHRVIPSGPSLLDCTANAALYFGAVTALAEQSDAPESMISFEDCKNNFYHCAQHGLEGLLNWYDGQRISVRALLKEQLLPLAHQGLESLGVVNDEARRWLGIIEDRLETGQNGSVWQRNYVARHSASMAQLQQAIQRRQQQGLPVHQWDYEA